MKIFCIVAIVMLSLFSGCKSEEGSEHATAEDEQAIRSIEEQWSQAELHRKVDFLEQTLADNYVYTGPDGNLFTRSQILDKTKGLPEGVTAVSSNLEDVKTNVYGSTAVVTGLVTQKFRIKDQEATGKYRYTRIYRKQDGRWRAVMMQATLVSS